MSTRIDNELRLHSEAFPTGMLIAGSARYSLLSLSSSLSLEDTQNFISSTAEIFKDRTNQFETHAAPLTILVGRGVDHSVELS